MSLRKLCVFLFVNCIFIFRNHSKHLRGFVCHEIFGNLFRHSEMFGLHPPPPPPQLYMLATALVDLLKKENITHLNTLYKNYAPINVRPAGGGRRGKGAGFDIQTKFCVKFPTPGIQVLVKSIVPRGN